MKPPTHDALNELKRQGHRMTRVRSAIIQALQRSAMPLAVADLRAAMKKVGLRPNKTTIYRELTFLIGAGLVVQVDLGERKKRYESSRRGHHHHLVCLNCHAIAELEMDAHLTDQEKQIRKEHNFRVLSHSLEFFGLCQRCQS